MRKFIDIVEAAQRQHVITPEQAKKAMTSFYVERGVKIGKNTRLWRGVSESGGGTGRAALGTGLYFAASRKTAASYGKVIEVDRENLPWRAFRFKSYNDYEIWVGQTSDALGFDSPREMWEAYPDLRDLVQAIDPNADGIQVMTGSEAIFVKYPTPEAINEDTSGFSSLVASAKKIGVNLIAHEGDEVIDLDYISRDPDSEKGSGKKVLVDLCRYADDTNKMIRLMVSGKSEKLERLYKSVGFDTDPDADGEEYLARYPNGSEPVIRTMIAYFVALADEMDEVEMDGVPAGSKIFKTVEEANREAEGLGEDAMITTVRVGKDMVSGEGILSSKIHPIFISSVEYAS